MGLQAYLAYRIVTGRKDEVKMKLRVCLISAIRQKMIFSVMLALALLGICCCGCASEDTMAEQNTNEEATVKQTVSEEVKTVEKLIDELGVVTLQSKEKIKAAEVYYSSLTDKDKNAVKNYDTLAAARAKYDDLENRKAFAEVEEKAESLISKNHNLRYVMENDYDSKRIKCNFYTGSTTEDIVGDVKFNWFSLYDKSASEYLSTLDEVVRLCRANGLMDFAVVADVYLADEKTILFSFNGTEKVTTQNLFQELYDKKLASVENRNGCVIRNLKWGDSAETVFKNEIAEVMSADDESVAYNIKFANYDSYYHVSFDEKHIVDNAGISCKKAFSESECFGCYEAFKKELSAMFGEPIFDERVVTNSLANYTDAIGALKLGYARYFTQWENKTTEVILTMYAKDMGRIAVLAGIYPK